MKGDGVTAGAAIECEVLECNWWPVQVYLRCQQTMLSGMAGAVLLGVSAVEVRAVCSLMRVPRCEWPDVLDGAQALAGMVAKIENEKAKARSSAKGKKG
jgi:hypothetical protein